MPEPSRCAHCDRPTSELVCEACGHTLRRLLGQLPGMLDDLAVTVTKQARTSAGGSRGKGHEYGLPFAWGASDVEWTIRNTVRTWKCVAAVEAGIIAARLAAARAVLDDARCLRPLVGPVCAWCDHPACVVERHRRARISDYLRTVAEIQPAGFPGACRVLAGHVDWLRRQPCAAQAFDELMHLEDLARSAVDSRSYRYIGPCTALVTVMKFPTGLLDEGGILAELPVAFVDEICGQDLRLYAGAKLIRCHRCTAEYDADDTQLVAQLALRDHWDTAAVLAKAVTHDGTRVTPERLRNWANRGLLTSACRIIWIAGPIPTATAGETVYRFGEVLDLLAQRDRGEPLSRVLVH